MPIKSITIENLNIYTENGRKDSGYIKIEDGKIVAIGDWTTVTNSGDETVISLTNDFHLIPGMIDIHIHGADGADTMDSTSSAIERICKALPKEGTTSFLPTTITQESSSIEKAVETTGNYINDRQKSGQAEPLGIHLEGPFISAKQAGAQPPKHIKEPDIELFKQWNELSNNHIKVVTHAPEIHGGLEFAHYLHEQQIISSIGHSDAKYDDIKNTVKEGSTHVTHLFNGMRGIHHREPGVAGGALLRPELFTEVIVDGIHVCSDMVDFVYQQKTADKMILITDAMRAKGLKDGKYDLGGQEVTVEDGKAYLSDGTLAGSLLKMIDGFKNLISFTGCSIEEAIKMASTNPAKQLNVFDRKGSISEGKDADLVILDQNLDIMLTICRGEIAYQNMEGLV
ncbi:N-acetylglucosamine-6-phosphate deacetylase [Jeotgalibacillus marinus]|uniref:N-acetylglucosamine-6-phosphate deacetylase n=1 Tax=Jeotgalibacillus marinus TaxID=86667 RepID=A0ABV3Q551_9BACL